jgi:hypothetical protein
MNKGLLLGGLALAAGAALFASGKANAAPGAPLTPSGPVQVKAGDKYQLVFATSRPITIAEMGSIQQQLTQSMTHVADVEGVSSDGSSTSIIANVAYTAPTTLQIGAIGSLGSNPADQIIIQLISFHKVL